MSLTRFEFTKDWNNPNDFPTVEDSEINVRRDMQSLHDEAKDGINHLIDELESTESGSSGASQIGVTPPSGRAATTVQGLLNAYDTDISTLNAAKHTHANKDLLDTYNQSNTNIADAVTKRHTHSNKSLLDTYTQTEVNLADAVSKKHSHSNMSALNSVPSGGVVTTLGSDNTTVPTSKAVADALGSAGYGDMLKSSYDPNNTGNKVAIAQSAEDSAKLNGQAASYYAKASDIPSTANFMAKSSYDPHNTGTKVAVAETAELAANSSKLNGQSASYYAKASDIPSTSGLMAKSNYDPNNTGTKVAIAQSAEDSAKLNGQAASYYAKASDIPSVSGFMSKSNYDPNNTGTKVAVAQSAENASKLNGQAASYYATASSLSSKQDTITSSTALTCQTLTGGITYATADPGAVNVNGIKFVVMSSEPSTKRDGYLYIITDSE